MPQSVNLGDQEAAGCPGDQDAGQMPQPGDLGDQREVKWTSAIIVKQRSSASRPSRPDSY